VPSCCRAFVGAHRRAPINPALSKTYRVRFSAPLRALSKVKDVGQLGDEGSFDHFSGGAAPLVVDQEEIAERLVDEIEADVAGDFLDGAVVLNQSVQEHIGIKGVTPARGHQMGREIPGR